VAWARAMRRRSREWGGIGLIREASGPRGIYRARVRRCRAVNLRGDGPHGASPQSRYPSATIRLLPPSHRARVHAQPFGHLVG
jgi:hypothetical protein